MALLAWAILVPVNWTNNTLAVATEKLEYSDIDKLSIANVPYESLRLGAFTSTVYLKVFS